MYETFEKLPDGKKEQILQICIEEFARNGYTNTSTNTIVKRLGISKGLLFLYFKSKKDLYLYLVDYLMEVIIDYVFDETKEGEAKRPLSNFSNLGEYYKTLIQQKPDYVLFLLEAVLSTPLDIRTEIETKHGKAHEHFIQHLDTDGFRKDVDLEAVANLLHLTTFHIGQMVFMDYQETDNINNISKNVETYLDMFSKCMDIIKYGVYERNV
jgi:AcrR family transcriptional regulator